MNVIVIFVKINPRLDNYQTCVMKIEYFILYGKRLKLLHSYCTYGQNIRTNWLTNNVTAHTIAYSNTKLNGITINVQNVTGFFYTWTQIGTTGAGGETITDTFDGTWIEEGKLYDNLFGNPIYGIIILSLILAALVLGFIKENNKISGILLIVAGVLLLVFRYIELNDQDLFFYESETDSTFVEVPLGFLAGLISGLMNLRSSS